MDFAGFSVDNNAITSIPKMIPNQNGYKHLHHSHNYYLQHRQGTFQHTYPTYTAPYQQLHGVYYHGVRNHSRASTREKHVQHSIQVSSNVQEETKISLNKIRKAELLAYAPKFIEKIFLCDPLPPPSFPNQIPLPAFLLNIMNRTRINTCTLVAAFFYLDRLKQLHPRCKGSPGSGHRLMLAAIVLAAKYMYDDTFDNTAWATVSSGLFKLEQVNHMEREMLTFLDFKLFIKTHEWYQFTDKLWMDMNEGVYLPNPAPLSSPSMTLPNRSQNSSLSFSRQNSFSRQDSFPRLAPFSRQNSASTMIQEPVAPIVRQGWIPQTDASDQSVHVNPNYGDQKWINPNDFLETINFQ